MKNTFKKMLMVLVAVSVMASMLVPAVAEDVVPTEQPTQAPVVLATSAPTTAAPTQAPEETSTEAPAEEPTETPTEEPAEEPTEEPTETPSEEPTEEPVEFTGSVEIVLENTGDIYFGDTVVLRAVVTNANISYDIRWEVLEGSEWVEIEGEDEETYEFVVTEQNCDKEYRVVLITEA